MRCFVFWTATDVQSDLKVKTTGRRGNRHLHFWGHVMREVQVSSAPIRCPEMAGNKSNGLEG